MSELFSKVEERFGIGGAIVFAALLYVCLSILLVFFMVLVSEYPVAIATPFIALGYMILASRKGSK